MGRKKVEKTEEIVSADINTPVNEENVSTEDGVKNDAENPVVEQAEKEEEKEIDKITFDGQEISLENATLENKEIDLTIPEEIIEEVAVKEDEIKSLKDEPTELSNFIFLLEEIINSNQDVDFDILNLKNQIRKLIAEFK